MSEEFVMKLVTGKEVCFMLSRDDDNDGWVPIATADAPRSTGQW